MTTATYAAAQTRTPSVSAFRQLDWSVRRELWENRSIYLAPLAAAALVVVGSMIGAISLPAKLRATAALEPMRRQQIIEQPYTSAALLIMFSTTVVAIFYCLDALHGERRDRSILFWKSLPVSDLTTVLAKASIPMLVLPLLSFAITLATQLTMLLIASARLLTSDVSVAELWSRLPLSTMSLMLLYHLLAIHALWYAPFYGWLIMISAWARRAAFVWAALPVLAVGIVERIAFNSSHFAKLMEYRLAGPEASVANAGSMSMESLTRVTPGQFLATPGLWIGLAVGAAFLAIAARLRRYSGPV